MDRPLSPQEHAEATRRVGAGIFSYLQLQRELARQRSTEQPSMGESNSLNIPIPKELLYEASTKVGAAANPFPDEESSSLLPSLFSEAVKKTTYPLALGTGISEGFGGAKAHYYQAQKAKMQQELDLAQKEYLDTLMHIRKHASTPAFDALCVGIASALDPSVKIAADDELGDNATSQLVSDILHKAVTGKYSPLHLAKGPLTIATGAAISPALIAGYLTYNSQRPRKEEDQQKFNSPTNVQLQPY